MRLESICRDNPEIEALVADLGLIPVDSVEYRSLSASFFHKSDPFEADRLLFMNGYVSPSTMVRSYIPLWSVSDLRQYNEAISEAFDSAVDSDWFFTGSLFGYVS